MPTAADDVFFDANSGGGTVTVAGGGAAQTRNFVTTGATTTFAGGTTININGPTVTLGSGASHGGIILGINGNGVTCALTTNGAAVGQINVGSASNTSTVTCSLQDALTVSGTANGTLTLNAGTLTTNNFTITCGIFSSTNSNTRTLTLGSSSITITTTGASWNTTAITGLTITANTATITMNGTAPNFRTGSINYNGTSVVLDGTNAGSTAFGSDTAGSPTFANLTYIGPAAKTGAAIAVWSPTITGTLTFRSNNSTNRMFVSSNAVGTQKSFSCAGATVVIDNTAAATGSSVDFMDLTITGSPTWTVNHSTLVGDCGGNGGAITANATAPSTQTHTASAGGNWSDVTKWTSRVPLPQDNVVVDVNTTGTLTADMPRLGADINFTGFAGAVAFSASASIFGNLTMNSTMTRASGTSQWTLGGRGSQTFTNGGWGAWGGQVQIAAPNGTYTLTDAFSNGAASGLLLTTGGFATAGFSVTCLNYTQTGGTLTLGTSTVSLLRTGGVTLWSVTGGTVSAASSTIVVSSADTNARTFAGGGKTYGTVTYTVANSPGQLVITGANTFTNLNVGSGRQLQMPASTTNNFAAWNVAGSPNGYLYLPGVAANYASAPDTAALSVTGDIDIRAKVALDSWTPATAPVFVGKWGAAGHKSFEMYLTSGGAIHLAVTTDGSTAIDSGSSATVALAAGTIKWIRATRVASTGVNTFYTSDDGSVWTQLGTTVTGTSGNIFDSDAVVEVGSNTTGTASLLIGKIYRAQILSGVGGTVAFDADFTAKTVGANTFTESSTNAATVTINGTLAQAGDGRVALTSSTGGTQATINYTGAGVVNSDYLTIQDSNATPGSTWYAGTHSTNVSNNTGWTFTAGDSGAMSLSLSLSASAAAPVAPTASLSLSASAAASVSAVATASLSLAASAGASAPAAPTASLNLVTTASAAAPIAPSASLALALSVAAAGAISPTAAMDLLLAAAATAPIVPTESIDLLLAAAAMATPTASSALALLLAATAGVTAPAAADLELILSADASVAALVTMALELAIVGAPTLPQLFFDLNAVGIRFGYLADPVQAGFKASAPAVGFVAADTAFGRQ